MENSVVWGVVNRKTGKLSWTVSGHLAIFRTRREARNALQLGMTCLDGTVVRLSS